MATWFDDTFTDTDLTLLAAHTSDSTGTWSMLIGPSPQIFATAVAGKSLVGPGPTGAYCVARASVIAPNADAKIPFGYHAYSVESFVGLALRVSGTGTSTRGYAGIFNTATSKAEIYKFDSSGQLTGSPLASSSTITLTAGDSGFGEFGVAGTTLSLTFNGVTITATDATISAAGYAALIFAGTQGHGIFLDFVTPQDQAASPATAVTLTGPTTGTTGAASTNFTVGANGTITGTVVVTPSDAANGGTFIPTSISISSGAPTGTFTYTPASSGAKTISVTNNGSLANPSNITYTASSAAATATTLTGPTSGISGVASTSFTVGANGVITGTVVITPSDAAAGGTFTPTTVSINTASPTGTFTYTPASAGAKTISTTNNGSLTSPSNITYTASAAAGAPTAGAASFVSASASTINLSATAAAGGTVPLTYQWYRSTTANFAPGAGTVLAGATSLTLADSASLSANVPYYYTCRATDAAALTADSNQVAGVLKAATLKLGFIGDSITFGYGLSAGQDPASQIVPILKKTYKNRDVTATNSAVSGSKSSQWVTGQSNLTTAKSAFATAGVTHVHCMLGANDAAVANLVSAATYKSNLQSTITDLTGAGYKVILSYPTYLPAGANSGATTAASVALAQSYQAQIDSLIDNVNVLRGDTLSFNYFIDNLSEYQADQTHPTATGAVSLATMWARAIDRSVLDAAAAPTLTSRTVSVTLKIDATTLAANLTGLNVSFWDEALPNLTTTARYQSAVETTDTSGVLTFACGSTLTSGATGYIAVRGSGVHYNAPVVVA